MPSQQRYNRKYISKNHYTQDGKTHEVHGKAADKNQLAFTARTRICQIMFDPIAALMLIYLATALPLNVRKPSIFSPVTTFL